MIGVEDSLASSTGQDGRFEIDCRPGRAGLWMRKDGYLPIAFVQDVSGDAKTQIPRLEMIQLPAATANPNAIIIEPRYSGFRVYE